MEHSRDTSPRPPRNVGAARRSRWARASAALLALAFLLPGCAHSHHSAQGTPSLLSGQVGGALAAERLAPAAALARRFAAAYARSVYLSAPPRLPGATASLESGLLAAAARVPPARRDLRPHAVALALEPRDAGALAGTVEIGDGRSPPFSVGFLIKREGSRWRVVAISPPG